jgi:hypothetical protein
MSVRKLISKTRVMAIKRYSKGHQGINGPPSPIGHGRLVFNLVSDSDPSQKTAAGLNQSRFFFACREREFYFLILLRS